MRKVVLGILGAILLSIIGKLVTDFFFSEKKTIGFGYGHYIESLEDDGLEFNFDVFDVAFHNVSSQPIPETDLTLMFPDRSLRIVYVYPFWRLDRHRPSYARAKFRSLLHGPQPETPYLSDFPHIFDPWALVKSITDDKQIMEASKRGDFNLVKQLVNSRIVRFRKRLSNLFAELPVNSYHARVVLPRIDPDSVAEVRIIALRRPTDYTVAPEAKPTLWAEFNRSDISLRYVPSVGERITFILKDHPYLITALIVSLLINMWQIVILLQKFITRTKKREISTES